MRGTCVLPVLLVLVVLLSLHCGGATPPATAALEAEAKEPYDGSLFKRVTLVVADLDRSLTLYRDVLGFQIGEVNESSEESYSYPVFKIDPGATIRFATASAGEEQVRTLGFTEVTGMDLPAPGRPHMTATVLRTRDIEGDFGKIEALGLETVEPKFVELTEDYHFWERAFVDFDGHLIVLYEVVKEPGSSGP